jgi:DNA anti-recombination protein RmuC
MEARLSVELIEKDLEEVAEIRAGYMAEVEKIEPKFREWEAKLLEARTIAQNSRARERSLNEQLSHARQRLAQVDQAYAEEQQRIAEQKSAELQEAMGQQFAERAESFDVVVDQENREQGIGVPLGHVSAFEDE